MAGRSKYETLAQTWITGLVAYNKPKRQGGQIQNTNFQMSKTINFSPPGDHLGLLSPWRISVI